MILKASQRGGAKQLGLHLLKTEENEHVEVHEIRGFVSEDVVGALKEAYAVSKGTKCKQFLFSVSLNPPETEKVGVEIFENAADRIEEKTGLTGQPRVIVFHEKEGRRHAHAVWSRIDADSMTAVNMAHFKVRLRDISRELYLENDWQMPRGLMNSAARDPRNYSLVEYQQAKRLGRNGRDLKAMFQECWAVSDSRAAFEHALGERGLILAKGDRRGHVAVTPEGEVLSVARYTGKKAKEVRAKLGEPDEFLSVDSAKAQMAQDMSLAFNRLTDEARQQYTRDMAPLDARRRAMTAEHQGERERLNTAQRERWAQETRERQERLNRGLRGLWDRLTGRHSQVRHGNEAEVLAALQRDRDQRDTLVRAQLDDRQKLQAEITQVRQSQADLLKGLRYEKQICQQIAASSPPEPKVHRAPPTECPQGIDQRSHRDAPAMSDHFKRLAALRETRSTVKVRAAGECSRALLNDQTKSASVIDKEIEP